MTDKPSNSQFARVFDRIAPKYDKVTNSYAVSRRISFITKYAKGKCLEVGAGSGEISKSLLSKHEVIATDISPKMVDVIKKKLKIKTFVCDAEKLPFKNSSFDTVIASETIYYLDHPESFVKESFRVLKNNGKIIITSASKITEAYDRIRTMLRKVGFGLMYFDDKNRKFMSLKEIGDLLINNGFKVKKNEMAILLPLRSFDKINRLLEKTLLKCFCGFIFIYGEKTE